MAFDKNANVVKGAFVLDSIERIYDIGTKNNLHLPMQDKENIYCVLRWMMREFSNLRVKIAKSEKILYESLDGLNRRTMAYNKKIVSVPSNLVAFLAKLRPLKVYEIEYISR